jgi:hypothetical protein
MASKDTTTGDEANIKLPANDHFEIQSDKASSDASDITYTPPSSSTSMTSASSFGAPASSNEIDASSQPSGVSNISIREYIYLLPYPLPTNTPVPYSIHVPAKNPLKLPPFLSEPTSTLVLTSPHGTFVDVRLFKSAQSGQSAPPNEGERSRLEWAFAGISTSRPTVDQHTTDNEDKWENVTHSTWTHWLDSRYPIGSREIPVDEGDMYPIDAIRTLEHGHGYQPRMKAMMTHEEMWRDVDAMSTNALGSKMCVVLRLKDERFGARGVVVRVGQYCQGIMALVAQESCTVERWEFHGGDAERDNGLGRERTEAQQWKRTARVGDLFLPCAVTFRTEILRVGGLIRYKDYLWTVEEAWEWE